MPTVEAPPELLKIAEVAQLLRISASNVYRLAERGELPGACKVGAQWRVSREQLLAGVGLAGAYVAESLHQVWQARP
jgi:excisionase family DNA binding protein